MVRHSLKILRIQVSKFHGNGCFGTAKVSWTSNLQNRFIGAHNIFCD